MNNFRRGLYIPSYLNLRIENFDDLGNIRDLSPLVKATYFHEYTHFLQDISTFHGLSNMWNTYDRIRQVIGEAQRGGIDLIIPMKNEEVEKQYRNIEAVKAINGDKQIKTSAIVKEDFSIRKILLTRDENVDKVLVGGKMHLLNLKLENSRGESLIYNFGGFAVSESMAYLMEQNFHCDDVNEGYPYCAAYKLALFVCERIADNKEFLFTICDVAMMTCNPGFYFYIILLELKQREFFPISIEELCHFSVEVIKQRGWNIIEEFESVRKKLLYVFNQIYSNEAFKNTREWFNYIVNESFKIRMNNMSFIASLYTDEPFGKAWEFIVIKVGLPEVHNLNNERWFSAPFDLKDKEELIYPVFLLAAWQLHDLILTGERKCKLISFCQASRQKEIVNEDCSHAPWKKLDYSKLCSFCSLWVSFGLDKKNVVVN